MTQLMRTMRLAASLVAVTAGVASAQRSRGTLGVPRVTTPPPTTVPAPSSSGRGVMGVPRYGPGPSAQPGTLPRIVTHQGSGYIRGRSLGYGTGSGYRNGSSAGTSSGFGSGASMSGGFSGHRFGPAISRRWRPGYTQWGVGCAVSCFSVRIGGRSARFVSGFSVGYPLFFPVYLPYFYGYSTTVEQYAEPVVEQPYTAEPEPERAASKLIVVGGGSGSGGDALTVETIGDSVRLSWLGSTRPAREVKLFVADSAQRQLATRSASPSAPTATFEVETLAAPVAFAGVTVTFADGVTTTTTIPYRAGGAVSRPR